MGGMFVNLSVSGLCFMKSDCKNATCVREMVRNYT